MSTVAKAMITYIYGILIGLLEGHVNAKEGGCKHSEAAQGSRIAPIDRGCRAPSDNATREEKYVKHLLDEY